MPNNSHLFNHISKKFKSNDNSSSTSQPTDIFSKNQSSTLSPPNVNPKDDIVLDQLLNDQIKRSSKRLFFDHSSRILIDKPSPDSYMTNHKNFVSFNPSNSLKKEYATTSSKSKEQSMKEEVLSLYPKKEFFESMVEMIRARIENNLVVDLDYLKELLALYLIHNEESMYDHIYSAYTRVMVDLSHTFG